MFNRDWTRVGMGMDLYTDSALELEVVGERRASMSSMDISHDDKEDDMIFYFFAFTFLFGLGRCDFYCYYLFGSPSFPCSKTFYGWEMK